MYTRLLLLCFICLLHGCQNQNVQQMLVTPAAQRAQMAHQLAKAHQTIDVPVQDFNHLYIEGPLDVTLHVGKGMKRKLVASGSTIDLSRIKSYNHNGTLYIGLKNKSHYTYSGVKRAANPHAHLDVYAPDLYAFYYKGNGQIDGKKLHMGPMDLWLQNPETTSLSGRIYLRNLMVYGKGVVKLTGVRSDDLGVTIQGSAHVELKGKAALKALDIQSGRSGRAFFSLYWLKGKDLVIRASGQSNLQLAGELNRLDGVFSNQTHFNGKHLKVKEAFVKTNDNAVADINVTGIQHALSRDISNIYTHNMPDMRADFMAINASVLDMRPEDLKISQKPKAYSH